MQLPDSPTEPQSPRMSTATSSTSNFKQAPINLLDANDAKAIRTIPELIEYNAEHNPNHLFCLQATKNSATPTIVTYLRLKQAVSRCSKRLLAEIPELKLPYKKDDGRFEKCPPVALLMESDLGLLIHLFALMSLGIPVALFSARLSPTAVHHLLNVTDAKTVIASPRLSNTITQAVALAASGSAIGPAVYTQTPFDDDLRGSTSESPEITICGQNHFICETDRNVLILHSSGTTGLPKPIYHPHRYLIGFCVCYLQTGSEDDRGLNMSSLPLFHGFGLVAPCLSLGIGKSFWMGPGHVVPTGGSVVEALRLNGAKSLMTVPHILEEITFLPQDEWMKILRPLQFVASGGGPLKASVGEKLANAGVKVLAHFGATEIGPLAPIFAPAPDYDWRYFRIRQDINLKIEAVERGEHDVEQYYKITAYPFGWEEPFAFQDRFVSSPQNPGIDFKAVGRNDDLIVLATGEKVLPRILESLLCESGLAKAAVAFGDSQFELGVIVEPTSAPANIEKFKSDIWPLITEAGKQMDDHARISSKASIIVTRPGQTIPRSDKGSILRKEAYRVFDAEIKKVYEDMDNVEIETSYRYLALNTESLEPSLKKMIQNELNWPVPEEEWGPNDDFFELGMSSLGAVRLRRLLLSFVSKNPELPSADQIPSDFVYKNPSVTKIAAALLPSRKEEKVSPASREKAIDDFVNLYFLESGSVVLLTGSTGSLGSHVLAHLVSLPNVAKVICLNRLPVDSALHEDPYERQFKAAEAKGAHIPLHDRPKVEVIQTDSTKGYLGLERGEYQRLSQRVTHIIHCAWPMDFKRMLPSFESQFRFLHNLLRLAKEAHNAQQLVKPRVLFVSSIAVVGQYASIHGTRIVPEVPVTDSRCTNHFGYGQGKLVCERIMENAARTHQQEVEVTCVRVGQMSGSRSTGFWNTAEHFPALVQLSQKAGRLPKLDGTLSWIPVDSAAAILSDILLSPDPVDLIYHLENPVRQAWHDVLTTLSSEMGIKDLVPFTQWLDMAVPPQETILSEFFRHDFRHMSGGSVILDTQKARAISPTLRDMDALEGELIKKYVEQWRKMRFLK